jgi:hypothetical protein
MIVLLTDFGLEGPYVGQLRAVLLRHAPGIPVVNLFADLSPFNPRAAAYLLPAYVQEFPPGSVFLVVVDPGVGSQRGAVVMQADTRWYVAPDNGVLEMVSRRASGTRHWAINYQPERLSASFHGRDLFAPVAARLALGAPVPGDYLEQAASPYGDWPHELFEVVYIDRFGNAVTGMRAAALDRDAVLEVKGRRLAYARVFAEAAPETPFWYENANGLVELALREASLAGRLGLAVGDEVSPR